MTTGTVCKVLTISLYQPFLKTINYNYKIILNLITSLLFLSEANKNGTTLSKFGHNLITIIISNNLIYIV